MRTCAYQFNCEGGSIISYNDRKIIIFCIDTEQTNDITLTIRIKYKDDSRESREIMIPKILFKTDLYKYNMIICSGKKPVENIVIRPTEYSVQPFRITLAYKKNRIHKAINNTYNDKYISSRDFI